MEKGEWVKVGPSEELGIIHTLPQSPSDGYGVIMIATGDFKYCSKIRLELFEGTIIVKRRHGNNTTKAINK